MPRGFDGYKTWRANEHQVLDITIRHDVHALSTFFQYAVRHHWALSNPIEEVDVPSDADAERIHVLTAVEEEDYFLRAARLPDLHDVGRVMINQGMRPEEVTCLAKADINFESGKIHVVRSKTKASKRYLEMTTESRQILERRMAGQSKWIFPSKKKRGSHIGRINSAHDRTVAKAAKDGVVIEFVPYDFRHTFATRAAAEDKVDLPTLAALLGHGSLRSVMKYVHPTEEHKRDAMKRIDRRMKQRKPQTRSSPKALVVHARSQARQFTKPASPPISIQQARANTPAERQMPNSPEYPSDPILTFASCIETGTF